MSNDETLARLWTILEQHNDEYLANYLGTADGNEPIVEPSSELPTADKNNLPKYGLDYFDLVVCNLLMREVYPDKYPISANVADLITYLGYEGLRHCGILTNDTARRQFCRDIALNRTPDFGHLFGYLKWLDDYPHPALPVWFYYTIPLWVLLKDKAHMEFGYRSHLLVKLSYAYSLTLITEHAIEREHDTLRIQKKMLHLVKTCMKHKFLGHEWDLLYPYLLSTMREFSVLTLSALTSRFCYFDEFKSLGVVTKGQFTKFHQMIVDKFYKNHCIP